jgi:hypothetical protein
MTQCLKCGQPCGSHSHFCSPACRQRYHAERANRARKAPVTHGTRSGYRRGCRCRPCSEANTTYFQSYRTQTVTGPDGTETTGPVERKTYTLRDELTGKVQTFEVMN